MVYGFAILVAAALGVFVLLRTDPVRLANALRLAGPLLVGLSGIVLMLFGRAGLGGMLISGALAWYLRSRGARSASPMRERRSTVRTAAIEMELDHDTGKLDGTVLAGKSEGVSLSALSLEELLQLAAEWSADAESIQLLETYLDGRFPVWRENTQADGDEGLGVPPGSGAMTKEEAYKILGLEAGAAAADILEAHRRLMQSLGSDVGDGTSVLAARLNEAKDVLLSNHD